MDSTTILFLLKKFQIRQAKRMNDNAVGTAIDFYIVSTESSCADCLTYLLISARVEQVSWI